MHYYPTPYQMPYYQPQIVTQFPQYPQSEMMAHQQIKQPLYPQLKDQTLSIVAPFVQYGLKEAQATSFAHALQEVAAMTYLIGRGFDPQTAYATVESWELNETFY
jgi:ABC-type Fe3+ transport system permease subunit